MKLSIIIPVFNEEKTIIEILSRVASTKLPNKMSREIIVVDDGSKDKTVKLIKRSRFDNLKLFGHPLNMGKGAAVILGLKQATGDILLIQDADLEYDPNDYEKLLIPIISKRTKVVYGNRFADYPLKLWGKNKTVHPSHWVGNKVLTLITNLLFNSSIHDMETCYKVFTKEVLSKLDLKSHRFNIEPEITGKILRRGYKIYEIPIKVKPRSVKEGKKISWKDGFRAICTLFKYRLFDE